MKKLKAALILLLALMMSLCLFACGGGEEEPPTGGGENPPQQGDDPTPPDEGGDDEESEYRKIELDPGTINLTDSDEQAKLDQALAGVTVYATDYEGEEYEFHLSDCNYTSNVTLHEVGEYSFDVALKSDDSVKATLTVRIDHDWKTESSTTQVCQYDQCKARRVTQAEDVIIHYGTFHEGTNATLPSGYWDETSVYTNKKADTSIVKPFGEVDGLEVPTLTAGQLEPGMIITIRGRAMTTSGAEDVSPWGKKGENKNWNSPTIGIADRYNMYQNPDNLTEYKGGVSVLVRQEGWVLYNGIGDTDETNRLGGIIGGKGENAGGWKNYGSHDEATADTNPGTGQAGYIPGVIPTDWSNIGNWWVYSTGATFPSLLNYAYQTTEDGKPDISKATEYEYSWNYREDGVIEITYNYIVGATTSTLKSYIKVPESSVGYYDTIIHGDYNDMTITESVVTTKRTPKAFRYNGLKSGANSVYAENKPFDAGTLNVEAQYEQTGDTWNTLQVSNSQVYYYKGSLGYDELGANEEVLNSTDSENWVCLGSNNALKAGAFYKIHIVKGGQTFVKLLPQNTFTVLPNKVGSAEGADVTVSDVLFANNGKLGDFTFSVADSKILLTLANGYVQALDADQKGALSATTETKYVALRLNGAALGEAFKDNNVSVKKDGATAVPSKAVVVGDDLYLAIALTEGGKYTVSGAQATDIVLDLTNLKGFKLSSKIEGTLALNNGGELTLTYTVPSGTTKDQLTISVNDSPYDLSYPVGADGEMLDVCTLVSAELSGTTLTVKLKVPAADLSNYAPINIELSLSGANADTIVDVVDYDMTLSDQAEGFVAGENGAYAFVQKSGTLSVVTAFDSDKLANGVISGRFTLNINDGNYENFRKNGLLTVVYDYTNGQLNLHGAPSYVTGVVKLLGTYGDNRDTDKGAFVVINIDVSGLSITGDYYFNFVTGSFDSETTPSTINKVSARKITQETVTANECEVAIIIEGTCQQEGLYAWAVTKNGSVVFYANAAVAGGQHVNEDDDGLCDLCGATISEVSLTHDENNFKNEIRDGEFIEISGKYNDVAHGGVFNGIETNVRQASGDAFYVRVRNDGYYAREAGGDEQITLDYNSTSETHGVDAGTCNGVPNGIDGTPIDEASYRAAKPNGTFKVYASYVDGVVTVVTKLWKEDQDLSATPYFQYTVRMTVVSKAASVMVNFRIDSYENTAGDITTDGKCNVVKGNVSNSTITEIKNATVGGHAAPTQLTWTNKGNAVVLNGNAAVENGVYYAAFEITFEKAIDANSTVYVRKADGNIYANATATLDTARTKLSVYLPLAADVTSATIDFVNFAGNTMQGDIVIDLSKVLLSDVQVTASKSDLALTGDTFDLTYTGTYPATAKIAIGEDSVALSDLASASESAPVKVGDSLFSVTKYDASAKKISFKFAGVSDYMKDVAEYVIALTDENGATLANISVYPNTVSGYKTQLESSGWYLVAVGGTLVLVSDKAEAENLPLVVNAGKAYTDKYVVGMHNLGYKNGKFVDVNVMVNAATLLSINLNGKQVTAIAITLADLTGIGTTADGAYGVMLATEGAAKYYTVAADRQITEQDATKSSGTKQIATHSETEPGKSAKMNADESFYWDFDVDPAHNYGDTVNEDGNFVCEDCGAVLHAGYAVSTNVSVPEGTTGLDEKGMSVSFWLVEAGNDWDAIGVWTNFGKFKIALPNIQANNQGTDVSSDETIAALRTKIGNGNAVPSSPGAVMNGVEWNAISASKNIYVTISVGPEAINFYKDGVKVFSYPATMAFPDSANGGTMGDFIKAFLLSAQKEGVTVATPETVYGGSINAKDALVEYGKAYTDAEATARYNAYISERNYYPTHTHSYGDNDRCTCGELNPNHGNTEAGGKAHSYDPANGDKCTMCGEFNPNHSHTDEHGPDGQGAADGICDVCGANLNHVHSYDDGICTGCGSVCDHADESGDTCSKCGATLVKNSHFDNLTAWTDAYRSATPLTKGHRIVVYGKQQSTMAQNWNTINWELTDGFTGRLDNWGWTFNPGDTTTIYSQWTGAENDPGESESTLLQFRDKTNKVDTSFGVNWVPVFVEIAKDCLWRVEAYWQTADIVNVKCTLTALSGQYEGYSFDIVYAIKLTDTSKTELGFRITADGSCPSIDVTGHLEGEIVNSSTDTENSLPAWPSSVKSTTLVKGGKITLEATVTEVGTFTYNGVVARINTPDVGNAFFVRPDGIAAFNTNFNMLGDSDTGFMATEKDIAINGVTYKVLCTCTTGEAAQLQTYKADNAKLKIEISLAADGTLTLNWSLTSAQGTVVYAYTLTVKNMTAESYGVDWAQDGGASSDVKITTTSPLAD